MLRIIGKGNTPALIPLVPVPPALSISPSTNAETARSWSATTEVVQIAARRADPRTTTVHDRRRQDFDKRAAYIVVAFVAGG